MRLAVALLLASVALVSPPIVHDQACTPLESATTGCATTTNTGTQLDISGSETRPGGDPDGGSGAPPVVTQPVVDPDYEDTCEDSLLGCRAQYAVDAPPDVTLEDLASFVPDRPTLVGEPEGFGVVGMPTNLVAAASEQHLTGEILDWPVTVRFTPVAFVFAHGDGTSARSASGGSSWQALGQGQLTPTATSHVYRERGTYTASVTVEFAPYVDFGGGWVRVPGVVTATTGGYGIRVVELHTALVDKTCLENPTGPGC
ncbi:hypothetical protein ACFQRL_08635 [Microbacterium fluvii]|uniref:PKD domain-containing protein n=1 Tax=Microbacterium fluvii TaxID=415215 RepID=A0ABW2HHR5_9MICO|nr:hypothetical protein [Microbacterium fluvii]MCU4672653.1 hypothetical protein [Microbacterium fluvii]